MSGGRPEVILPQDPTPVLGLCVPGFPLWAPPQFLALELGPGSASHCTPDWTTYGGDLKGCSTLSQECCPSSASCSLVEKKGTLEETRDTLGGQGLSGHIRALLVTTVRHFNILWNLTLFDLICHPVYIKSIKSLCGETVFSHSYLAINAFIYAW